MEDAPLSRDSDAVGTGEVARPIASGPHASLEAAAAELLELNSVSKEQLLSFVSQLPSDQLRKSSAPRVGSVSFSTGAFVHAHVPGIRHNTRIFPNFTKLLCRYVKQACPTFSFTALVILHNLLSDFHRDLNNLPGSLNCVLPLSDFSGGQLWIQDEGGPIQQQVNGRSLSGSLHEVHASPVLFDARSAWHKTLPWEGDRTVLVAFTPDLFTRLDPADRGLLESLGFVPPPVADVEGINSSGANSAFTLLPASPRVRLETQPPAEVPPDEEAAPCCLPAPPVVESAAQATVDVRPAVAADLSFPPSPPPDGLTFFEVFSGSARLSLAFKNLGVSPVAVDAPFNRHKPLVDTWALDLTQASSQALLLERITSCSVLGVHVALPSGTGSRARERPVPPRLRAQGAPHPRPLRNSANVLGLPGLSQTDRAKVEAANKLADFTVSLLALALRQHFFLSIENPGNSWMWSVLAHCVRSRGDPALAAAFSNLHRVSLSMCMWGGSRPKNTLLLCTSPILAPMALQCSGDHQHLPFKLRSSAGSWVVDSTAEAEYPAEFCHKFASLLSPPAGRPPELPLPRSTTRQKASRAPLVPEYARVTTTRPAAGDYKSLFPKGVSGSESVCEKFGVFHSKEQFLAKAITAQHPFDSDCCIDDQTRRNIFDLLTGGLNKVSRARLHTASMISKMSKELEPAERAFQDTLTGHAKQVLEGKRVILWRKLLQETNFPDVSVASLIEGVDLVGKPSKSPLYAWKEVLPTCTPEELVRSAAWKRKSLQQRALNS